MNELLAITVNADDRQTVSGRDLHNFLEVSTRYNDWFTRMLSYGFSETIDFVTITQKRVTAQGNETTFTDHMLTIDMVKELCMLARNEKGKQARKYFLEIERDWNSPEKVMARALKVSQRILEETKLKLQGAEEKVAVLTPKAEYTDTVLSAEGGMSTTQIAKDYGRSAKWLNKILQVEHVQYKQGNQWVLYQEYADKDYTISGTYVIQGHAFVSTYWTQKGRRFIYNLIHEKYGLTPRSEVEEHA